MSHTAITRRGFLAASAAGAALAASGATLTGCASGTAVDQAYADEVVNTQCTACPKQCGYAAYVVDGNIDKVVGNATNPSAAGTLCARGFGSATSSASADRLTQPQRRTDAGTYEPVEWDVALEEIGFKVNDIVAQKGPEALASITDGTSTATWYTKRLLNALGSANTYVDAATASDSVAAGLALATGFTAYEVDYAKAKLVVILGASTVEMPDPGTVTALEEAKAAGATIIMVDSRMPASSSLATEWLAVHAGTDLALVLALAHELEAQNKVCAEAKAALAGYDQWVEALADYTPNWAAGITGLSADRIATLAMQLADAAPQACLDLSWLALYGGAYANSGELARATALVNTMLGCWNIAGGAYVQVPAMDLSATALADLPVAAVDVTAAAYPLAVGGTAAGAIELAHEGAIEGLFLVDANVVAEYPSPDYVKDAIEGCTLSVAIVPEMTETAACCTYVLPAQTWAESAQLPTVAGATHPVLVASSQVVQPAEGARSVDEIIVNVAEAVGKQGFFPFTLAEAAEEMCKACGTTWQGATTVGTVVLERGDDTWRTASGLVECASDAAARAGYTAVPTWVAPAVATAGLGREYFRLTTGNQAVHAAAKTVNDAPLAALAKQYELDAAWMNAADAATRDIADGDRIELHNEYHTAPVKVHVTELIEPDVLYLASHYGVEDDKQTQATGVGVRQARFAPFALEMGYGAPLTQETMVSVGKAGA